MTELEHYGIKGQEWGTRRFQYEDGSLTPEGKIRYGQGERKDVKKVLKQGLKEAKKNERKKVYFDELNDKSKYYNKDRRKDKKYNDRPGSVNESKYWTDQYNKLAKDYHEALASDAVIKKGQKISSDVLKNFNSEFKLGSSAELYREYKKATDEILSRGIVRDGTAITKDDLKGARQFTKSYYTKPLNDQAKNLSVSKNAAVSRTLREMDKLEQKYSKLFGSF